MRRPGILVLLAVLLVAGMAATAPVRADSITVKPGMIVGRWAMNAEGCNAGEMLEFTSEGGYRSTLDDDDPHEGRFRTERDHIILLDASEPDRELALVVLDLSANRMTAFDETIEADRMLVRCR